MGPNLQNGGAKMKSEGAQKKFSGALRRNLGPPTLKFLPTPLHMMFASGYSDFFTLFTLQNKLLRLRGY